MSMERGLYLALSEGSVSIPSLLLQGYAKLGLNETDMMLLIHLISFKEKEQKDFPTIDEIQARMSANPERVIVSIQKLLSEGWITIDEDIDPATDIQYERYNVTGVFEKLADSLAKSIMNDDGDDPPVIQNETNLFVIFEREFGRPISPMECETIAGWIDKDGYTEQLIIAALKESVFSGKLHFRYIDRILLEWARNRIRTPEEARDYAVKFRGDHEG
jgi:DNA replication protein